MRGLLVIGSEFVEGLHKVVGWFEGKPFEMTWDPKQFTGEIDGEFDDTERMQLLTVWEIQQFS